MNPVQSGGGIKTKMVEAIAYGTTVISTESGAAGMDKSAAGNKLVIVKDNDWKGFADAIVSNANIVSLTPDEFYKLYAWENVTQKVTAIL